jgi:hypothetical protein
MLSEIVCRLVDSALRYPGRPASTVLTRGLHVRVTQTDSSNIFLELRRESEYPSIREWEIVTRSLPWQCSTLPSHERDRYILSAQIPIQKRLV